MLLGVLVAGSAGIKDLAGEFSFDGAAEIEAVLAVATFMFRGCCCGREKESHKAQECF